MNNTNYLRYALFAIALLGTAKQALPMGDDLETSNFFWSKKLSDELPCDGATVLNEYDPSLEAQEKQEEGFERDFPPKKSTTAKKK